MNKNVKELFEFINAAPTSYNAVSAISARLEMLGAVRLSESEVWNIECGKTYYVTRNMSSVIMFNVPESGYGPFKIIASHCDSPIFKLKDNFETISADAVRLDTERYGGMIMSSWFDRPLSIAGRVVIDSGSKVETKIVDLKKPVLVIPNMPIHFNRNVNDGYTYNAQTDMMPIAGSKNAKGRIAELIAKKADADIGDIIGYDLFVYCAEKSTVTGVDDEYLLSPRLDDLECAFSSLKAFENTENAGGIQLCCIFDNEEVGSGTKQGADSSFLSDTIDRITLSLGKNTEDKCRALASSFMLSADNAHAVHPNHTDKYDTENRTYMNGGVVIKYNANQKYTTDGISAAIFRKICNKAGVPCQSFANRSDIVGGSTLGNISNSHVSVNTVDIGLAQLAMHSAVETAGSKDLDYMISAMTEFYNSEIISADDGTYLVK